MEARVLLLVATIVVVMVPGQEARRPIHHATACGEARVYITVSPQVRSRELRQLELAWNYEDAQPGDQLALYDYDPMERRPWHFARHGITYNVSLADAERSGLGGSGPGATQPQPPPRAPASQEGPYGGQYGPYANQNGPYGGQISPGGSGPGQYPPQYGPTGDPRDPSRGQGSPYGSQGSPSGGQGSPYDGQGSPYGGQGSPYGGQGNPYGGQGSPYGGQGGPYGSPYGPGAGPAGPGQYPPPYNGWGGSAAFPAGPRDAFGGRARRQDDVVATDDNRPPVFVLPTDGLKSGWRPTSVQENHVSSSQLGYKPRCLNHWVAYERPHRDGSNRTDVLAVSCLRTRPTWMWDFREEWMDMTLSQIAIPGTHDSAAYREDGQNGLVDRYTITQDESILGQLIYGVRYIDLRVGYYPRSDTKWWANHGPVRLYPLLSVFHDIKAFLGNTNEIVILDVQNFPVGFGSDNTIHHKLVHLLETELGDLMMPRSKVVGTYPGDEWKVRLRDIWQGGRRLIVGYDKEDVLSSSNKLWLAVNQHWGNVQTPEKLHEYVTNTVLGENRRWRSTRPWAIMAQLTLDAQQLALHPTRPLRRWAYLISRNVTAWAETDWRLNVLAVDFIRGTNVVEAAILKNLRRNEMITQCDAHQVLNAVYEPR